MQFLTVLLFLFSAFAITEFPLNLVRASSTEINYQGKLMNGSGVAVTDGDYNIELKIYDAPTGGTLLWTETRTGADKVTVNSGLFSILLGSVASLSGIDFDQDLYLTVNVGGTGSPSWDGEMNPRKKIASVPRAFVADTAKGLDSVYATSTNLVSVNATSTNFNVVNNVASTTVTNSLTISTLNGLLIGTNGFVTAVSTSSLGLLTTNVAEGSNLYFTNQRADDRIAVASTTIRNMLSSGSASLTYTAGTGVFSVAAGYEIPLTASTTEWASKVSSQWDTVSGGINYAGGNVGIGTTTPGYALTVAGDISVTGALRANGNAGTSGMVLQTTGTGVQWVATSSLGISGGGLSGGTDGFVTRWTGASTVSSGILRDNGTVAGVNATSSTVSFNVQGAGTQNPFNVASSTGTSMFTVLANGNVGIGTTNPGAKLEVNGSIAAGGTGTAYSNAELLQFGIVGNVSNPGASYKPLITGGVTDFTTGGFSMLTGFGIGSPIINMYSAFGSENSITFGKQGYSSNPHTYSPLMVIKDSGNVGIGTTTPIGKLSVIESGAALTFSSTDGLGNTNTPTLRLARTSSSGDTKFELGDSAGGQSAGIWLNSGGEIRYVAGAGGYFPTFYSNGSEAMRITTGGNVGIGTTTPSETLTIVGTAGSAGLLSIASSSGASMFSISAAGRVQIGAGAGSASPSVFVLDTKNTSGDPTGVNGAMYYNSNSGKMRCYIDSTWTDCTGAPAGNGGNILYNNNGTEGAVSNLNWDSVTKTLVISPPGNLSPTWSEVARATNKPWQSIKSSANGKIAVASASGDQLYISTTTGSVWVAKDINRLWRGVSISRSGSIMAAVVDAGQIYVSTTTGETWTAKDSNRAWLDIDMSEDGSTMAAVVNSGQVYVSTTTGDTWVARDSSRAWNSVAVSEDGSVMVATVASGYIYVSLDEGVTWTQKTNSGSRSWTDVDISANGQLMVATVNVGNIYVSNDFGENWSSKASSAPWVSVAISGEGKNMFAVQSGISGGAHISKDFGDTWTGSGTTGSSYNSITTSYGGDKIMMSKNGTQIYTVDLNITEDSLNIVNRNGDVKVSVNSNGVLSLYDINGQGDPDATVGALHIYTRSLAGRLVPRWMGPSGLDTPFQPALFSNSISMWLPGAGTTVSIAFGTTWTARNAGTAAAQAHPTVTSTDFYTTMRRATFTTGTTATGASGIQSTAPLVYRGNSAGLGGFFYFARVGVDSTYLNSVRMMNGLSAHNAVLNAEPSTLNNSILLGKDSTDTTWEIITRNGSSVTKYDTGHTIAASKVYDFYIFAKPNDSKITVRLVEQSTAGATVIVDNYEITDTLPVNTTFLYAHHHIQATDGLTGKIFSLNRIYVESDL